MEDDDIIEEVEFLGKITDPREETVDNKHDIIEDHEEVEGEIEKIKEKRNKIITLHLYIERGGKWKSIVERKKDPKKREYLKGIP